jgi:hypothetical protein
MGEYFEAARSFGHTTATCVLAEITRHGFRVCEAWRKWSTNLQKRCKWWWNQIIFSSSGSI